jgi:hypothetical protein
MEAEPSAGLDILFPKYKDLIVRAEQIARDDLQPSETNPIIKVLAKQFEVLPCLFLTISCVASTTTNLGRIHT